VLLYGLWGEILPSAGQFQNGETARPLDKRVKSEGPVRQIHVRVSVAVKKAIKMLCAREGATEQAWIHGLIEEELKRKAPDLWPDEAKSAPKA
jgi:hypothetical protein